MSDTPESHQGQDDHEGNHEGPVKTPKQLVLTVLASFVVPIVIIIMLANYVASGSKEGAGSEGLGAEAVARRLQAVGSVEIRDASAPVVLRTGEQTYEGVCGACHNAGAAGAPKLGEEAAWAARIKTGYEALLTSALKGKGAMPAQSGGEFTDVEIARAVVYMTNKAGAKFDEPKVPAAAASAASGAASTAN